jgi:hypothetical protein
VNRGGASGDLDAPQAGLLVCFIGGDGGLTETVLMRSNLGKRLDCVDGRSQSNHFRLFVFHGVTSFLFVVP